MTNTSRIGYHGNSSDRLALWWSLESMTAEARIAKLAGIIARHQRPLDLALAQNAALQARVEELEARVATDRHDSDKPPSSDGRVRKTERPRRRSGTIPGGHIGHRGDTLRLAVPPDAVVEHRPQ